MLTSMTGFGRAVLDAPFGKLIVEIQSVNRKVLEVFVSLPKELSRFEQEVRKGVGDFISRGAVSVRIFLVPNAGALSILPDGKTVKELKKALEKIAKEIGTDPQEITLPFLMQTLSLQQKNDFAKDADLLFLQKALKEALEGLLKMKKAEGKALQKDLEGRLKFLGKGIAQIEKHTPDATKKMRQKLLEKMQEVLKPGIETEERLLREVALFAERVDVSEEITRFHSHIAQFKGLLKGETSGRKMDFLIQELGREVNTIGSKAMEANIAHLVVELKAELEKMREQVQNLE